MNTLMHRMHPTVILRVWLTERDTLSESFFFKLKPDLAKVTFRGRLFKVRPRFHISLWSGKATDEQASDVI